MEDDVRELSPPPAGVEAIVATVPPILWAFGAGIPCWTLVYLLSDSDRLVVDVLTVGLLTTPLLVYKLAEWKRASIER